MQEKSLANTINDTTLDKGEHPTAKIGLHRNQNQHKGMSSSTGILNIPEEVFVKIASYASLGDITDLHSTNRDLSSRKDYTMSSIVKGMNRDDAFEVFSKLVIGGNVKAVKWLEHHPRFRDSSDTDDNDESINDENENDEDNPFLERTLNVWDEKREEYQRIGTALHVAAYYGHRALVDTLLIAGAPIKAEKGWFGRTALHVAAREGQKEVVECLLQRGADIDGKDKYGDTALHFAVRGHGDVTEVLLERGADIENKNFWGHTAFDCAVMYGNTVRKTILRKRARRRQSNNCGSSKNLCWKLN